MNTESILQRTRVLLNDEPSVKFSNVQLETALGQVLVQLNAKVPHVSTLEFTEAPENDVLVLPVIDGLRNVLSLQCLDLQPPAQAAFHYDADHPTQLELQGDFPDQELHWRLKAVVNHRIEGLDGAETSTIPNYCEMLLASGTAAYALQMRNTQLSESVNQETAHYQAIQQNMKMYENQFQTMLMAWQSAQPQIEPVFPDGVGWPLD